jgi:hypothetical protein
MQRHTKHTVEESASFLGTRRLGATRLHLNLVPFELGVPVIAVTSHSQMPIGGRSVLFCVKTLLVKFMLFGSNKSRSNDQTTRSGSDFRKKYKKPSRCSMDNYYHYQLHS